MRLAVVADIHGNLLALEAVIADIAGRRVDAVVNLGDCVSGPLWPRETLQRLRGLGWPTVRGNHDRWVGGGAPATLSRTDRFAADELDEEGRAWLAALPTTMAPAPGTLAFHARPDDDDAYLLEEIAGGRLLPADLRTVAARLAGVTAPLLLCAHSHLPAAIRLPGGPSLVNPGSVGCPAYHDDTPPAHVSESGSPAARYAVLDLDPAAPGAAAVALIALPYDHEGAARRALACDRPDWAAALRTGTIARDQGP